MPALTGFCGPTGVARSSNVATDRLINLYLEESSNQKGVFTLYSMPGLRQVALLPSGPVRGLYECTNGRVFAVTSTTLFEVFEGWTVSSRGTVPTGTTPASMVDDGAYLIITVDGAGFAFEFASNAFTNLPATGPTTFGPVVFLDGYVMTNEPGTRNVWYAELFNPVVWPGTNVFQAEGRADNTVVLLSDHSQLWVFGTQTIELWDSTGNYLAPFARNASVFVEQGCETPWSVIALDNTIFFLGGTPRGEGPVWGMQGYEPQRISTHAMEASMSAMETVGDCIAWTARHGGHALLGLDFPTGGETWAFDAATGGWMELAALADDGTLLPYPCNQHCSAFAEHLWGDRTTGALYIWDIEYHKYGTGPRLCRRTAPHVRADQRRIRHKEFRLEAEVGVGLDAGVVPGSVPQAMLRYSDDGGHVWSQARWRSLGKIGATSQQAVWLQLGISRSRAYEVSISDPVPVALLAAYLEVG